jgi:hypothetical protein
LDDDARYIISMEVVKDKHVETKGEHFHFVGDMSDKQYDTFRKTIIVKKHNRQGIARNGIGRQYGKIGKIRDETKLMTYTCKDKNLIFKNIDLKTVQQYIQESYKKEEREFPFKQLMETLKSQSRSFYACKYDNDKLEQVNAVMYDRIEFAIIQFYLDNSTAEKTITKSQIKNITTKFLMYYTHQLNISDIYNYIMR